MTRPCKRPDASELCNLIGEPASIRLSEEFGGLRLYVPKKMHEDHQIAVAIGLEAAGKLTARYAPDVVRIPLARELRAIRYRMDGLSNARIAVKLGLTEGGVDRLFQRLRAAGEQA